MRRTLLTILSIASLCSVFAACEKDPVGSVSNADSTQIHTNTKMKIIIGSKTFTATLYDNETATALAAILPLTAKMSELNGNEKYFDLSKELPAKASNPGTINTGDLMLWGDNTLVLFYKSFSTSYAYTRIGRIEDAEGLATALGSGGVTVTFEIM